MADMESVSGRIWDWQSSRKRVSTAFHVRAHTFEHQNPDLMIECDQYDASQHQTLPEEFVISAAFHPRDEDILLTYGQQHLILWQLIPDKTGTERKTLLNVSKSAEHVET
jgi:hypothetical protein